MWAVLEFSGNTAAIERFWFQVSHPGQYMGILPLNSTSVCGDTPDQLCNYKEEKTLLGVVWFNPALSFCYRKVFCTQNLHFHFVILQSQSLQVSAWIHYESGGKTETTQIKGVACLQRLKMPFSPNSTQHTSSWLIPWIQGTKSHFTQSGSSG